MLWLGILSVAVQITRNSVSCGTVTFTLCK